MLAYGAIVSFLLRSTLFASRAKWLIGGGWILVSAGLGSTQLSARRAATATHLRYEGVLVERTDTVRIGAGERLAEVHLPLDRDALTQWSIRIRRNGAEWIIDDHVNVDQVRVSDGRREFGFFGRDEREWRLSGSAVLRKNDDWAALVDEKGRTLDTLRRSRINGEASIAGSSGAEYRTKPVNRSRTLRYRRNLRQGTALSSLDGKGRTSAPHERFVRVRYQGRNRIDALLRGDDMVLSSAAPFRLIGPSVESRILSFVDSALIEVRQGSSLWRFRVSDWKRSTAPGRGIAVLFDRNPRVMDTPLPAGRNCAKGTSCGAISLRRLPPPISYVSLAEAGFDSHRYGLLGHLTEIQDGFLVTRAKDTLAVLAHAYRPTAVPVEALDSLGTVVEKPIDRWVLLSAQAGAARGIWMLVGMIVGIGLLLLSFYRTVAQLPFRIKTASRAQERWISLGITSLFALLIARTIVGARVALFSPFLDRAIETVVGMWIAIALVTLGLLSWPRWAAPLLSRAHLMVTTRSSLNEMVHAIKDFWSWLKSQLFAKILSLGTWIAGAGVLAIFVSWSGVKGGLSAAFLVLLTWVTVAWVAGFTSEPFRIYASASEVVDSLSPSPPRLSSGRRGFARLIPESPEAFLLLLCFIAALAVGSGGAIIVLLVLATVLLFAYSKSRWVLRHGRALLGGGVFILILGVTRLASENGSLPAFILVLLITLVSVRFGRFVGSGKSEAGGWVSWLAPLVPIGLLVPLALIDMGLFLVMVFPLGMASVLAAGSKIMRGLRAVLLGGVAVLLLYVIGSKVLWSPVGTIRRAGSHAEMASAFERNSRIFGLRLPGSANSPLDRAAARSIATRDQALAEQLLIAAAPGEARDLLMPSIEQIWGARTYSRAGLNGVGTGRAVIGDRGVATAVSYAENSFSVYVLAEHGASGALLVLLSYLVLAIAIGGLAATSANNGGGSLRASRALFVVAGLIVVVPAAYVALSNVGKLPITGQNMPFLGLNAWSDVAICAGVIGILITGAIRNTEDAT
jgi:hypothetical protein